MEKIQHEKNSLIFFVDFDQLFSVLRKCFLKILGAIVYYVYEIRQKSKSPRITFPPAEGIETDFFFLADTFRQSLN